VGDAGHTAREKVLTMQRNRRLASMAVVASLAIAGLSACRSGPAVAAYVGDTRISEQQVQEIWADARDAVADLPPTVDPVTGEQVAARLPITRTDVVNLLVSRNLIERVAERHQVSTPTDIAYDQIAGLVGLPAKTQYLQLYARNLGLQYQLEAGLAGTTQLSDTDLEGVLRRLVANGAIDPATTVDKLRSQIQPQMMQQLQAAVQLRDEVSEVADQVDLKVNPRYQPMEIGTYVFRTKENSPTYQLVAAPVGDDAAVPVSDFS
jgi:hypothetical protein